jgi:hypothetical protein
LRGGFAVPAFAARRAATMPAMSSSLPPQAVAAAPTQWALRLGYAGLLPFVLGAALVWLVHPEAHPYVALGLSAYAALIVSFLGGIHWGIGMRQAAPPTRLFAWGVVPSLPAWAGLMMPPSAGLVIHGLMLLVCYAVDRRVYPQHGMAAWLTLRFRLSAVAALCCFLGAAGS